MHFFICVNLVTVFSSNVMRALQDLEKMKDFWSQAILLFTNAEKSGETYEERREDSTKSAIVHNAQIFFDGFSARCNINTLEYDDLHHLWEVRKMKVTG